MVVTPAVERVAQVAAVLQAEPELVAAELLVVEQVAVVVQVPAAQVPVAARRVAVPEEQEQAAEVSQVAVVRFPSVRSSKAARPEVEWPERRLSWRWRRLRRK